MEANSLYHYGVRGMRWGVRRYQNKDGSLTPAGRKRLGTKGSSKGKKSSASSSTPKKKSVSEMSDDELRRAISRLKLEREYRSLTPQQVSKGRKIANKVKNDVVVPAMVDAGKQILRDSLVNAAKKRK